MVNHDRFILDKPRGDLALPDVGPGDPEALEAGVDLPLGEVADEPHPRGVRRVLAEGPAAADAVQAVPLVGAGEVGERAVAGERALLRADGGHARGDIADALAQPCNTGHVVRSGFEPVGRRKNYYDKPSEDALLMTKFRKGATLSC